MPTLSEIDAVRAASRMDAGGVVMSMREQMARAMWSGIERRVQAHCRELRKPLAWNDVSPIVHEEVMRQIDDAIDALQDALTPEIACHVGALLLKGQPKLESPNATALWAIEGFIAAAKDGK